MRAAAFLRAYSQGGGTIPKNDPGLAAFLGIPGALGFLEPNGRAAQPWVDKEVDVYTNKAGKRVVILQRQDGSTYEREMGQAKDTGGADATPTQLTKLYNELDALAPNDPRRPVYEQMIKRLGVACQRIDRNGLKKRLGTSLYGEAVYSAGTVLVQPAALVRGLSRSLPANVELFENSPVTSLSRGASVEIVMPEATVKAGKLVLAVDGLLPAFGFMRNRLINLGLWASLTRELTHPMMRRRFGRIINITSIVGVTGNPGQANYCASKAGMIGFSKSLAQEIATRNVTVNCVAPGFIESAMTGKLNDKQKDAIMGAIPMKRMGTGAEVASAVLYLASNEAGYMTGQTLHINGGMVMP